MAQARQAVGKAGAATERGHDQGYALHKAKAPRTAAHWAAVRGLQCFATWQYHCRHSYAASSHVVAHCACSPLHKLIQVILTLQLPAPDHVFSAGAQHLASIRCQARSSATVVLILTPSHPDHCKEAHGGNQRRRHCRSARPCRHQRQPRAHPRCASAAAAPAAMRCIL